LSQWAGNIAVEFIGVIRIYIDTSGKNPRYIHVQNRLEMTGYPAIFRCMRGYFRLPISRYSGLDPFSENQKVDAIV
jgi:hypothetical protein